jgi:hypothetical protein
MRIERDHRGTARPENSRVFSLENLVDIGRAAAPRSPARADATAVPGFGGATVTGLGTAAPLGAAAPVPVLAPARAPIHVRGSDAWIIATIAMLTVAFVALATWVVTHPPEPILVAIEPPRAPLEPPTVRSEPTLPVVTHRGAALREPTVVADPVATAPDPAAARGPAQTVQRTRRTIPERAVLPPPPPKQDTSVECVLDPHLPKCASAARTERPALPPKSADPDRPETLSLSDVRNGVAPFKAAAKSCGTRHGAKPGTKVRVKLSIAGPTGAVTSTAAEPPHHGTALGNCVAAALKKASFVSFRKPVIGVVYSITM